VDTLKIMINQFYHQLRVMKEAFILLAKSRGDRTKWYGQNGRNLYRFQFNWIEFLFSNHKSQI